MCRYSANKVLIICFCRNFYEFCDKLHDFFIALDKETWYSNHSCIGQAG